MFVDRRTFLARIVQIFSALITAILALPIIRFIHSSLSDGTDRGWYPVAAVKTLGDEEITKVSFVRLVRDGWSVQLKEEYVWVKRGSDGKVVVFAPHCTHLACAFDWNPDEKQFICPCHGGKFNAQGEKVAGPPPRPLDRYQAKIENGTLKIGRLV